MKKLIAVLSVLCFAAAALILVFMPKPEKTLPTLPKASYVFNVSGSETFSDGVRKITKRPAVQPGYIYFDNSLCISEGEKADFEEVFVGVGDDDSVTYIITNCDVTLAAKDFISYKCEGMFTNASTNESTVVLYSHNYDFKTGEEISFDKVVSSFPKFQKAFARGKFEMVKNDGYLDETSNSEMLGNYSPFDSIYPDWYIDGEYFYVIADVPSAYGGLTEYRIPILEAEEFLNNDCELIKMIFTGE